ncbi:MAG: UDP-N-acetylglucosamine 2-epimerase (non-hydrolyzing) [Rhodospirillales bacterium]|nr:UDP-N-acetylglucosamine 2-epimerase (non-hydrolyzing) [Rhodospirillales bacterium]|tara:strand:- start:3270 stop:4382 length:1113 start_codon:yes stop_codon:yes gene_type:complete
MSNHKRILHIVGARPNFIKVGPLIKAIQRRLPAGQQLLVHTGQHFDSNMSDIFFEQLGIPYPDINLEVSQGSALVLLSEMIYRLEDPIKNFSPDCIVVYGDTNSTLAGALAGSKLNIPIAHVESGLRSRDNTMPEEINRVITDHTSSYLFTPSKDATDNLLAENIDSDKIYFVGNIMIDTLVSSMGQINKSQILNTLELRPSDTSEVKPYNVLTLHRPSNVDNTESLTKLIDSIMNIPSKNPTIFPVHPRSRNKIETIINNLKTDKIICIEPLGYIEFLCLVQHASLVITDSGGIQEETTHLGTPCITLRTTTERPITISEGTNTLINPTEPNLTQRIVEAINSPKSNPPSIPELWDGKTAERITEALIG